MTIAVDRRIRKSVTGRIAVSQVDSFLPIWTNYDQTRNEEFDEPEGGFVRNPDCWAADLDYTGVGSYRMSGAGHWACCAAVSPRHVLANTHAGGAYENKIRFILADNSVYTATISGTADADYSSPLWAAMDIRVFYLDDDLPSTVHWYKVLPADWDDILIHNPADMGSVDDEGLNDNLQGKGLIYLEQDRRVHAAIVWHHLPVAPVMSFVNGAGNWADWTPYFKTPVGGDSSSPLFLVVDGNLLYMGGIINFTASRVNGANDTPKVNEAMAALDAAGDNTGYVALTHGELPAAAPPTANELASMIGDHLSFLTVLPAPEPPLPDTTVSAGDRQQVGESYRGIIVARFTAAGEKPTASEVCRGGTGRADIYCPAMRAGQVHPGGSQAAQIVV